MQNKRLAFPLELKAVNDDGTIVGYGSVFGEVDSYKERVQPGAFKASLAAWKEKGRLPAMLWQHDPAEPIGVWESMEEDGHGLVVTGRLLKDDVRQAREAFALAKAGAVTGLSIGFRILDAKPSASGVIDLLALDLWEVSLVTFPACDSARVERVKTVRELEKLLRDAGLSRRDAVAVASHGFTGLDQRDADAELLELARLRWKL